jgi:hypothetical protein
MGFRRLGETRRVRLRENIFRTGPAEVYLDISNLDIS